jgi:NAD(P)-dependent dehydrogenase (short-subunit alcohol dehydrogenase family)
MAATVGIVTGASRGMGRACAVRLARSVDVLLAVDLDPRGLASLVDELVGGRARIEPVVLDVSEPLGLGRLAESAGGQGSLRAVAHAAGISPTMADWRRVLTVDLVGTARLLEALRPLVTHETAIVCFASMAANLMVPGAGGTADAVLDDPLADDFLDRLQEAVGPTIEDPGVAYSWAKRGVQRFVRQEACRLGPRGGRICSVSPGIIDTPQGRQEMQHHSVMQMLLERTPLERLGAPDEVAAVVSFLLSAEAGFVTGIDVLVDGGLVGALADRQSGESPPSPTTG